MTVTADYRPRTCKHCGVFVGHVPEHPCGAFRVEPETAAPTDFHDSIASHRNTVDGLNRYRKGLR